MITGQRGEQYSTQCRCTPSCGHTVPSPPPLAARAESEQERGSGDDERSPLCTSVIALSSRRAALRFTRRPALRAADLAATLVCF